MSKSRGYISSSEAVNASVRSIDGKALLAAQKVKELDIHALANGIIYASRNKPQWAAYYN